MSKDNAPKTTNPPFERRIENGGPSLKSTDRVAEQTRREWLNRNTNTHPSTSTIADYGTFKESLRAPIHRWFKYPAGYSYRLVEEKIRQYGLTTGCWILDPFAGSGTTLIEARRHGIHSIGIEAHPFVHWVAQTKLNWNLDLEAVASVYSRVVEFAKNRLSETDTSELPELVHKCYSPKNLAALLTIRDAIRITLSSKIKGNGSDRSDQSGRSDQSDRSVRSNQSEAIRDFLNLALTDTLRNASKAATGWPYISPTKIHEKTVERDAFQEFATQVRRMIDDAAFMQTHYPAPRTISRLILGDSRHKHSDIRNNTIDLALTSPPYLNNYDYADRTRLETYFFGWYQTWGEITEKVRNRLIISATTQIQRNDFSENGGLDEGIRLAAPTVYREILKAVEELHERRLHKGGKKSYDCMVAGYFNDMFLTLKQVHHALKPGSDFVLVLGDSAPYGVYIPTHEYLAQLGLSIGFHSWKTEELRTRGDKWKSNPQRHKVKLKELILTLTK